MFRRFMLVCLVCVSASLASPSIAAAGVVDAAKQKHFVMGGSAIGLRGTTKQDAETAFNVYLADLFTQMRSDVSLTIVIYPDTSALLAAFDKGEIDGFFGTPLDFLSREKQLGPYLAGIEFKHASLKQKFLVIARADDGVTQLRDLKNKRLTLGSSMDIEELYLNTELLRNKLPEIPAFFRERREAKSPNIALMDIFFNRSDVTVVRENEYIIAMELNPQLLKKLIVLNKSESYLTMVGVLSSRFPGEDFNRFVESFQKIVTTKTGKKLLDLVLVSRVVIVTADDVENLRELVKENASLRRSAVAATKSIKTEKVKTRRDAR